MSGKVSTRVALSFALAVLCAHAAVVAVKVWTHPSHSVLAVFRVGGLHSHGTGPGNPAQPAFVRDQGYPLEHDGFGTDGQQYLFVAHDLFLRTREMLPFIDAPRYRYGRVLLPALATATCGGSSPCIPRAIVGWNLLFAGGIGLLLYLATKRIGASPWWALLLSTSGALACATDIAGVELSAQFFGLLGVWLAWKERLLWSAVAFVFAVLARETYALLPLGFAAAHLLEKKYKLVLPYLASIAPAALWALFLRRALPPDELGGLTNFVYPLGGPIAHVREWLHDPRLAGPTILTAVIGAALLAMIALHARTAWRDRSGLSLSTLLFCALALFCAAKVWVRPGGFARGLDFLYPGIVLTALSRGEKAAAWLSVSTLLHTLNIVGDHFAAR
jgi:hypothetical protein